MIFHMSDGNEKNFVRFSHSDNDLQFIADERQQEHIQQQIITQGNNESFLTHGLDKRVSMLSDNNAITDINAITEGWSGDHRSVGHEMNMKVNANKDTNRSEFHAEGATQEVHALTVCAGQKRDHASDYYALSIDEDAPNDIVRDDVDESTDSNTSGRGGVVITNRGNVTIVHRIEGYSDAKRPKVNACAPIPPVKKVTNEQWDIMFQRLISYKALHGDCLVPKRYAMDPKLGTWVETQRVQYKRLERTKNDGKNDIEYVIPNKRLTTERLSKLHSIGFAWSAKNIRKGHYNKGMNNSDTKNKATKKQQGDNTLPTSVNSKNITARNRFNDAQWEEMYQRLMSYKEKYGDCLVPRKFPDDPKLATWVETQRVLWNRDYREAEMKTKQAQVIEETAQPAVVRVQPQALSVLVVENTSKAISANQEGMMKPSATTTTVEAQEQEVEQPPAGELRAKVPGVEACVPVPAKPSELVGEGKGIVVGVDGGEAQQPMEIICTKNEASISGEPCSKVEGQLMSVAIDDNTSALVEGVVDGVVDVAAVEEGIAVEQGVVVNCNSNNNPSASKVDVLLVVDNSAPCAGDVGAQAAQAGTAMTVEGPTVLEEPIMTDQLDASAPQQSHIAQKQGDLQEQPATAKRLTKDRKDKLDALGFVWSLRNKRINDHWDEMFRQLEAYKEKYGDCLVPSRFGENLKLGKWVETQRYEYTKLQRATEQYEKQQEESKNSACAALPATAQIRPTNPRLTEERLRRLKEIGFEWKVKHKMKRYYDKQWDNMFERLLKFKKATGHCMVPKRYPPDAKLGTWVHTQRIQHRKMMAASASMKKDKIHDNETIIDENEALSYRLVEHRRKRLDEVGFVWSARDGGVIVEKSVNEQGGGVGGLRITRNSYDDQWDMMFNRLKQYKEKHGHCLVPKRYKEDPKLGTWVDTQRVQYKKMKKKLASQGIQYDGPAPLKDEFGIGIANATDIMQQPIITISPKPIIGRLTDDRIRRLESLGFVWLLRDDWQKHYDELKEFKKAFGHCNVPARYADNRRLGIWVSAQRQQFKIINTPITDPSKPRRSSPLTSERIRLLNEIGFTWTIRSRENNQNNNGGSQTKVKVGVVSQPIPLPPLSWEQYFEELKQYKSIFGNCNVPSNFVPNPRLGEWVANQKISFQEYMQAKSSTPFPEWSISFERMMQLEEIGFALDTNYDDSYSYMVNVDNGVDNVHIDATAAQCHEDFVHVDDGSAVAAGVSNNDERGIMVMNANTEENSGVTETDNNLTVETNGLFDQAVMEHVEI